MAKFNPYEQALTNVGRSIKGVMDGLEPPRQVQQTLVDYQRRMVDPASDPEWAAIYRLFGIKGVTDYIDYHEKLKNAWR